MKTVNLNIDLMSPMQSHKEVMFNEAMLKIDSMSNVAVLDVCDDYKNLKVYEGVKYLSYLNQECIILFANTKDTKWRVIKAKDGMIFYVILQNKWVISSKNKWTIISNEYLITREELNDILQKQQNLESQLNQLSSLVYKIVQ